MDHGVDVACRLELGGRLVGLLVWRISGLPELVACGVSRASTPTSLLLGRFMQGKCLLRRPLARLAELDDMAEPVGRPYSSSVIVNVSDVDIETTIVPSIAGGAGP